MGLTQHRTCGADHPRDRQLSCCCAAMIGKPGAGVCPVRGHSNVQGDRTMGIWEKMPEAFLAALDAEFGIDRAARARRGHRRRDPRDARRQAPRSSSAWAATSSSATPDTAVTEAALRGCALTVQVSTKLNRCHVVHGRDGADPAVAGPHRARHPGRRQAVGLGRGFDVDGAPLARQPAARLATSCAARSRSSASWRARCSGREHPVPWERFGDDYDLIRDAIAARRARLRRLQRAGSGSPTASCCRTPPRDSREFPTSHRQGQLRGRTRWSGCRCRRAG